MAPSTPPPVSRLLAAANRHDTAGFLACFTDDGVVDDWGREFVGHDAIRGWSDAEFIGVEVRLDVVEVTDADADANVGSPVTIEARVGGNGFNGPSHFTFTVADDHVTRMQIRA